VPSIDLSATQLRERVTGALHSILVPDAVREYIAARGLYQ